MSEHGTATDTLRVDPTGYARAHGEVWIDGERAVTLEAPSKEIEVLATIVGKVTVEAEDATAA